MRYFVFSNYINAWSIVKGLNQLNLPVEIIGDDGLLPKSETRPSRGDVLFFTEERSLLNYLGSTDYHFLPFQVDKRLLDDKLALADFLVELDEKPIPYCATKSLGENIGIEFPLYLKARHSWFGLEKMPKGTICRNMHDVEHHLEKLSRNGWPKELFFLQKLISIDGIINYSTCGFFDYQNQARNLILVTRKVLSEWGRWNTVGAIVETTSDPANLLFRTSRILENMRFSGPFELEFLYAKHTDEFYVLELNPRFWMQHGIFIDAFDNSLIKAYLGLDKTTGRKPIGYAPLAWMDTVYLLEAIRARHYASLKTYMAYCIRGLRGDLQILWCPDLPTTLRYFRKRALRGMRRRLRCR